MTFRIPVHAGFALGGLMSLAALAACGSSGGDVTPPPPPPPPPGSLAIGESAQLSNATQLQLSGGTSGGEYLLVVTDTTPAASGTATFTVTASGIGAAGSVSLPATSIFPAPSPTSLALLPGGTSNTPVLDIAYGGRRENRSRAQFARLFAGARDARLSSSRSTQLSPQPARAAAVGDLLQLNVAENACDSAKIHPARVVAVGTTAIVVSDTLNPPGGFSSADFARIAANFDTLVNPLDVTNFGAPSDIDNNGHVILFFTRAVNELTPANSQSFVGGFFSSRDLFPHVATPRLQACPGSNIAEMFYLLTPDPLGVVNGNRRTTGFVDSLTTGVVGHEYQHLINASRRIYVNNANVLETVWLNEGLSHVAEELLFFRQSGLAPRQNIDLTTLRASNTARVAFNQDQGANAGRYRSYLVAPATNSPLRDDDSLATRGATWNFLRYATDRKTLAGGTEVAVWQALVNATGVGVANLRNVYGANIGAMLRDWSVSHYTDDVVATKPELTQPSWNWHTIYPAIGSGYPLTTTPLPVAGTTGTVIPGGAAFYRFAVPANATGNITVSGGTAATGLAIGTVVRVR